MKNWKQWHFFLCSPTFTIWCFPSSILPALSLPPCVLSMSSPWAPYHPPLPGNHPGIAFNQVSSSSRCFPGLWSGFAPSSLAFVSLELGWKGHIPSLHTWSPLALPQDIRKEIWREGKNLRSSSPSQLSLHALQSRMMSWVPCKVQDGWCYWTSWWKLQRSQQNPLQYPAGCCWPGPLLAAQSSRGRDQGRSEKSQLWISIPSPHSSSMSQCLAIILTGEKKIKTQMIAISTRYNWSSLPVLFGHPGFWEHFKAH